MEQFSSLSWKFLPSLGQIHAYFGANGRENFAPNPAFTLPLIFVHRTWVTYMFIILESCDTNQGS